MSDSSGVSQSKHERRARMNSRRLSLQGSIAAVPTEDSDCTGKELVFSFGCLREMVLCSAPGAN